MELAPGSRLGHYEILAFVGSGGMGEVHRARDSKLNRDVAIKVLHASVAHDPDRLARLDREAHVLASLNHPNIAQIHGIEDVPETGAGQGATRALVMEFVEGPTLADRLSAGPLPLDEALPIARQIAEALEAAHEQGIVHRDLKPANVKVKADGTVKILDFGLAKALDPAAAANADATNSPTLSFYATQGGVILGTAAYMAPEQARGRPVDRRADVWAFGCVLFEMLAGRRPFQGVDATDTIVALLSKEPDWAVFPATAAGVRPLVSRCLRKDPKQRLQAIGDARIQIDELMAGAADQSAQHVPTPVRPTRRQLAIAGVAGAAMAAAAIVPMTWRPAPPAPAPVRFEVLPPVSQPVAGTPFTRDVAVSPDGRHIVYSSRTDDQPLGLGGRAELVLRTIDRLDGRQLEGTGGANNPFFSPDGRSIGFWQGGALKRVAVAGGPPITVCQSPLLRGASWGDDGHIVFATQDVTSGLQRVSADGGEPTVLTRPDQAAGERAHWRPSVLPGARGVLFSVIAPNVEDAEQVAVLDLRSGQIKRLIRGGSQPEYVETGHLLYAAGDTLFGVGFDLARLDIIGDARAVAEGISADETSGAADYGVSRQGTLVHIPSARLDAPRALVWADRSGLETAVKAPHRPYLAPRISPDGTRVAVPIADDVQRIHVLDIAGGELMPLTRGPGDTAPVWSAAGSRIVFASSRAGGRVNLYAQAADGSGNVERLTSSPVLAHLPAWVAPDGTGIVGSQVSLKTAGDIWWFPTPTATGNSAGSVPAESSSGEPLVQTAGIDYNPDVSPDGRYVAYQSNEFGRIDVYVKPLRGSGEPRLVSTDGGSFPAWARNGREFFYLDASRTLTAVPVTESAGRLGFGAPSKLFALPPVGGTDGRPYDVAPDGRFLIVKDVEPGAQRPQAIVVVLNWLEELKARMAER
jgi:serine/threonine-protein kinase